MDLKRLAMVPLLSSAARMPLPGATSAVAVAASSSAVMAYLPWGLDSLQYPAEAVVGRVAQPAGLPAEEADLPGQLEADEHRGRVVGPGSRPASPEQGRRRLGERALGHHQRRQAVVDAAVEPQPARPPGVGQADQQGADLVAVGEVPADQERLAAAMSTPLRLRRASPPATTWLRAR